MCLFYNLCIAICCISGNQPRGIPPKKGRKDDVIVKKYCSKQSAVMHDSLINSSQRETSDDIGEKLLSSKQIFIFHNN